MFVHRLESLFSAQVPSLGPQIPRGRAQAAAEASNRDEQAAAEAFRGEAGRDERRRKRVLRRSWGRRSQERVPAFLRPGFRQVASQRRIRGRVLGPFGRLITSRLLVLDFPWECYFVFASARVASDRSLAPPIFHLFRTLTFTRTSACRPSRQVFFSSFSQHICLNMKYLLQLQAAHSLDSRGLQRACSTFSFLSPAKLASLETERTKREATVLLCVFDCRSYGESPIVW